MSRYTPLHRARALALGPLMLILLIATRPAPAVAPVTTAEIGKFEVTKAQVLDVAFLPDGRRFLCATGLPNDDGAATDHAVHLWDAETGKEVYRFAGHEKSVKSVAVAPDGKIAVSGSVDKTVRLWDLATGRPVDVLYTHGARVLDVAFAPDGRRVLTGSWDLRPIHYAEVAGRKTLLDFGKGTNPVQCIAFTPDGRRAVTGHNDKLVRLWDL
jgi:WD40 repeat protein